MRIKQDIKKLMTEYRKKRRVAIKGDLGDLLRAKLKKLDVEYLEALKLIKRKHEQ